MRRRCSAGRPRSRPSRWCPPCTPPRSAAASLIQAYSACGDLASARAVFDGLPPREALALFAGQAEAEMDGQAVTALLTACARAGMVGEGRRVFVRLTRPALQHYTCMVEMLGRAGEVDEAEGLVAGIEARPDRVICAALLAACRVHGRVDVAQRVALLMRRHGIA
jgi:pentatricopeptide repeat protein